MENVASNGRIIIPQKWRKLLGLDNDARVELELNDNKEIIVKKREHPLEIEDDLFADIEPFTDFELMDAQQSVLPTQKWSQLDVNED